ncbi:unnamed protein product, partial [Sphagnum compactum]
MRVEGRVYGNKELGRVLFQEIEFYHKNQKSSFIPALYQIANVAALPSIVGESYGLPDIHAGYGFTIGNTAAFDMDDPEAVVSSGGVGFDINCGFRMLRSNLLIDEVRPFQEAPAQAIFSRVPVGVGRKSGLDVSLEAIRKILKDGMNWAKEHEMCWPEDLERCEVAAWPRPGDATKAMGIHSVGQVCVMVYHGSRGLGYDLAA